MPQRETQIGHRKPQAFLNLGSVNERVQGTELDSEEWSLLSGTFPEFSGLQARIWGKRLLAKYANPIKGIYQFWTPLGYAGGLYQFDGTVDFGVWVTQTTKLDLSLPPAQLFDGGGYSLDDFGYEFGRSFTVSTPNVCVIQFAPEGATHTNCGDEITGANLPNDSNGGPAGQGKKCKWTTTTTNYSLNAVLVSQSVGSGGATTTAPATYPPFLPNPVPLAPVPPLTYVPAGVPDPQPYAILQLQGSGIISPPTQVFVSSYVNFITNIDLTPIASAFLGKDASLVINGSVYISNLDPGSAISWPLDIDLQYQPAYSNITISMEDYLPTPTLQIVGSPPGEKTYSRAQILNISIIVRAKVCS